MKFIRTREIVIEFERTVRSERRALTAVAFCHQCGGESDFLPATDAARLFRTPAETLLGFVADNRCHFAAGPDGTVHLCLASLLDNLMRRAAGPRLFAGRD
jgi:hypothetical protein